MAVDPSQSKIPRFGDGVTSRIPLPSAIRALKTTASKISKPILASRLCNPQNIAKSLSGDKINEQILMKKFSPTNTNNKTNCPQVVGRGETKCHMDIDDIVSDTEMECVGTNIVNNETLVIERKIDLHQHEGNEKCHVDQISTEKCVANLTHVVAPAQSPTCDKSVHTNRLFDQTVTIPRDRTFDKIDTINNPIRNIDSSYNHSNSDIDLSLLENIRKNDNFNSTVTSESEQTCSPTTTFRKYSIDNKQVDSHQLTITNDESTIVEGINDKTILLPMDVDDQVNIIDTTAPTFLTCSTEDLTMKSPKPPAQQFNDGMIGNADILKNNLNPNKPRFSFGLDLTDCSLDCSIELCGGDLSSQSNASQTKSPGAIVKQNSFEVDESLGILTPDQMKEFLDSATNTNLDLPLEGQSACSVDNRLQCRMDHTPSPEELPLDPVSVKTDLSDMVLAGDIAPPPSVLYQEFSQTDTDSKIDQMTKSGASKTSNSFITSVTSITSLDTGYQGDGEMSRPASRGADHSPSNLSRILSINQQKLQNNNNSVNWNMNEHPPIARRPDPMTDSDFFTESDADDILHRGDRRAQVIDGQLYGPTLQAVNVFINQQNGQGDDSCMESSGVFTDVENRGDDDLINRPHSGAVATSNENDMSPDTDTLRSSNSSEFSQQQKYRRDDLSMETPTPQNQIQLVQTPLVDSKNDNNVGDVSLIGANNKSSTTDNTIDPTITQTSKTTVCTATTKCNENKQIRATTPVKSSSINKNLKSLTKKLSPSRKQNKNEVNANLKKNEMSKRVNVSVNRGVVNCSSPSSTLSRKNSDDENQENKRPPVASVTAVANSRKITTPKSTNKWDAVMNKIEANKSAVKATKLNFNEIKSKVSCGVTPVKRTPVAKQSPALDNSEQKVTSTQTSKRIISASKRGRTYSKDSQQSSQSDISLTGSSPKPHSKISATLRSAKKRDAHTINNSPSDLGPPSKNKETPRSNRPITTQKRISPTVQPSPVLTSSPSPDLKGSPPAKKLVSTRQQNIKLPLKDHNRLIGPPTTQQSSPPKSTNNNNNINGTGAKSGGTPISLRSSPARNSSGVTTNHVTTNGVTNVQSKTPPTATTTTSTLQKNGTIILDSVTLTQNTVTPTKQPTLNGKSNSKTKTTSAGGGLVSNSNINHNNNNDNLINSQMISQAEFNLAHANKGIEALGVLIQHLVFNLDAFSAASVKRKQISTSKELLQTRLLLDDSRTECQSLEEELADKSAIFAARETELQALHQQDVAKAEICIADLKRTTHEKITQLEADLKLKEINADEKLQKYVTESELKLAEKDRQLQQAHDEKIALESRISSLTQTENELREKVLASESDWSDRLQFAAAREKELVDKVATLTKDLENRQHEADNRERDLSEKLNVSQDEIFVLRKSLNRSLDSSSTVPHNSNSSALSDEVESLRCVLELKQREISDLRKQNLEYQRAAEELPAALLKVSGLESRIEDLQVQLAAKLEIEKDLIQTNKHLELSYKQEYKTRKHLLLHNEELQYRLKQNSEKLNLVVNEFSKSYQDQSLISSTSKSIISENESSFRLSGSRNCDDPFDMDDISPPPSPIIKGVVEKSDSVSWVLEIDDEAPEVAASRVVRRAGSFRSNLSEKMHSSMPKRQKCHPNPLSQSASATSLMRQTTEKSPQKSSLTLPQNPRMRSKSFSARIATDPKKFMRSFSANTNGSTKKNENDVNDSNWKDTDTAIYSSSPLPSSTLVAENFISEEVLAENFDSSTPARFTHRHHRHHVRVPSFGGDDGSNFDDVNGADGNVVDGEFRPKRITCSTATLTTNRDELCPQLPSLPSVQDFKNVHKHHPREAAGEAMVSGSNSEDDASSLGGSTPMEVSWSEDGDQFPSESVV